MSAKGWTEHHGVCRDCGKHVGIRYAAEEGELRVYCIDCVWERWNSVLSAAVPESSEHGA